MFDFSTFNTKIKAFSIASSVCTYWLVDISFVSSLFLYIAVVICFALICSVLHSLLEMLFISFLLYSHRRRICIRCTASTARIFRSRKSSAVRWANRTTLSCASAKRISDTNFHSVPICSNRFRGSPNTSYFSRYAIHYHQPRCFINFFPPPFYYLHTYHHILIFSFFSSDFHWRWSFNIFFWVAFRLSINRI